MSDTPRTDAASVSREYIEREMDRYTQKFVLAYHMSDLERELAEARAEIVRLTKRKDECSNGWDAALAQRDKAIAFLHVYRNDTPLGNQPHMLAHEVDQFLKECGG